MNEKTSEKLNVIRKHTITKKYVEGEYMITIYDKGSLIKIECLIDNILYKNETDFSAEYLYVKPFEDLVSQFSKDKITIKKSKNEDELNLVIKDNYYINEVYYNIVDENKVKTIEKENLKYIIKLKNNNIFLIIIKDGISHHFKIGNNNLNENKFDDICDDIDNGIINIIQDNNNTAKLEIKLGFTIILKKLDYENILKELNEFDELLGNKNLNEVENILYYKKDDIKEIRADKILEEMNDKINVIKEHNPALLKNSETMKTNADLLIFPKIRFKVKVEDGVKMDTCIIVKKVGFDLINEKLHSILNTEVNYTLLYRASRDRDLARIFKEKCRDVKGTLVIVKTESNHIFGGFTFIPWDDSEKNYEDDNAFCFSIDHMKIYEKKKYLSAVGCDRGSGPRFNDMFMIPNKFMTSKKGILFKENQSHYSGQMTDFELTKGEEYFFVYELEVFKIEEKN